jgi:hypothetical protein
MKLRHPPQQLLRVLEICQIREFFSISIRPG